MRKKEKREKHKSNMEDESIRKYIQKFKECIDNCSLDEQDAAGGVHITVEEEWKMLTEIGNKATKVEKIKYLNRRLGYKKWWVKECTRNKGNVTRKYKSWKKGLGTRAEYLAERMFWRGSCKGKEGGSRSGAESHKIRIGGVEMYQ